MDSREIRKKFLDFFRERGHAIVPSSSLIPDDPSVLLTTAGMQQFKKYYTGELDPMKDFGSKNTASIQKSFRTSDIDEVGDETHLTFFEMLGHFSFGDYFKRETIEWTYELLTKVFGIPVERISATVFEGDKAIPFDEESFSNWSRLLPKERVRKGSRENNFWGPVGGEGPCGACNEVYVDKTEVATLVFMEYYCHTDRTLKPLAKKGVDVGWGLERLAAIVQKKPTIFETDLFAPIISLLRRDLEEKIKRVIADHVRGIAFLVSDGVRPSNKESGYILRRLLRRVIAYTHGENTGSPPEELFEEAVTLYRAFPDYRNLDLKASLAIYHAEYRKFIQSVSLGLKELDRFIESEKSLEMHNYAAIGKKIFNLYQSYGLPIEVCVDELAKRDFILDVPRLRREFDAILEKHRKVSRMGQEKKFGGHGLLLDTGELKAGSEEELNKVLRLHTATHLLQQALRAVLGEEVHQMGSDVTALRTRFDFSFPRKLTKEEIKKVEALVNRKIKENLPVSFIELPKSEAEKVGALHFFKEKYPEKVKVYFVGRELKSAWSKEFCGGPHITHTGEIGRFHINKEESVAAGVRRIRGIVE